MHLKGSVRKNESTYIEKNLIRKEAKKFEFDVMLLRFTDTFR